MWNSSSLRAEARSQSGTGLPLDCFWRQLFLPLLPSFARILDLSLPVVCALALLSLCAGIHSQTLPASHAAQAVPAQAAPVNSAAADFAQFTRYQQENADLLAEKSQVHVVFLGDSITDRWGRQAGHWFDRPGWINRGIGGQTTGQLLLRMRSDVLDLHPRAVVLEGASNDMRLGFSPEQIRDNIATMGELAQSHGITVLVTAMLPVCDCYRPLTGLRTVERIGQLNNLLHALCRKNGWIFIDWNPVLSDEHGRMRLEYTSDGVHPNDEGYRLLAPIVERALQTVH